MTDQDENGDVVPANDFLPDFDGDSDGDTPEFTLEEFDSDIVASARLMQDPADDAPHEHETDYFDPDPEEPGDMPDPIDAAYDGAGPRPDTPGKARSRQDAKLLSVMTDVFGARRAAPAARGLMIDFRRALQVGERSYDRAAALRWAVLRLARKSRRLDKSGADALFHRLSHLLLQAGQDATPEGDGHRAASQSELREACSALRDAARHLLRVERRLAERTGGEG